MFIKIFQFRFLSTYFISKEIVCITLFVHFVTEEKKKTGHFLSSLLLHFFQTFVCWFFFQFAKTKKKKTFNYCNICFSANFASTVFVYSVYFSDRISFRCTEFNGTIFFFVSFSFALYVTCLFYALNFCVQTSKMSIFIVKKNALNVVCSLNIMCWNCIQFNGIISASHFKSNFQCPQKTKQQYN